MSDGLDRLIGVIKGYGFPIAISSCKINTGTTILVEKTIFYVEIGVPEDIDFPTESYSYNFVQGKGYTKQEAVFRAVCKMPRWYRDLF